SCPVRLSFAESGPCRPRSSAKVPETLDAAPSLTRQDRGDLCLLLHPVFEQEQAGRLQEPAAVAGEGANSIEPVVSGNESFLRLELQVEKRRIAGPDIWRVGHDQVETLVRNGRNPIALHELNIGEAMLSGIVTRYGEGGGAHVAGNKMACGTLARQRDRDGTASCSQIQHAILTAPGNLAQRQLNQELRLRARHKHAGRNLK